MACSLKAKNGKASTLGAKLSEEFDADNMVRNLYYKMSTPQFKKWYGAGKLDANREPVLTKQTNGKYIVTNSKGETMTLDMVNQVYPDAPMSVVDPEKALEVTRQEMRDRGMTDEQIEKYETENYLVGEIKKRLIKKKIKFERYVYGDKKAAEIDTMLKQFDGIASTTAIHNYFSFALHESQITEARVEKLLAEGGTLQDMTFALDYVSAFDNLASIYNSVVDNPIPGTDKVFDKEYYEKVIAPVLGRIARIKALYRDYAVNALSEKLIKYNRSATLTVRDLQNMLVHATSDINYLSYFMDAMAESDDQVLALIDRMIKEERGIIQQEMTEFTNGELKTALLELEEFQKSRGVNLNNYEKLYEFMLEYETVDGKKRLTGGFLSADAVMKSLGVDATDPRVKFAKMFNENYKQSVALLPDMYNSRATQLPTILKTDAERAFEQGIGTAIKEGIKDALTIRADNTDYGDRQVYTDENGNVVKHVPVNYVSQVGYNDGEAVYSVQPTDISLNLASTLRQFMFMAKNHSSMQEITPYLDAAKNLLAERRVDTTSDGVKGMIDKALSREGITESVTKQGKESNAYKMLVEYLDAHVYGEFRIDAGTFEVGGWNIDANKLSDALMKYTATNSLAVNLFSGASNLAMGTLMNGIEAGSGFFFSSADFRGAIKEYGKQLPAFMKDASSRFTESDLGVFMETFDIFQEFNENGEVMEHKNGLLRNGNKALYFMQQSGEHFIQTSHAIAMMKGHKIHQGKIISYYEYLEITKQPKSKEARAEFDKLPNVYNNIKVDKTTRKVSVEGASNEEVRAFTERIKGNYQHNHGNYARQDAPNINRRWWGRMLMLFRKWLKPGINRRFSKKYYDQRLGHEFEGNYRTTARFLQALIKDIRQVGMGFVMYWNTPQYQQLSEWEKAQIAKTMREIMVLAAMAVLSTFLYNLQADVPEEDRVWGLSFAEFLANRIYQETFTFTNPKEFLKTLRSPSATLSSLENAVKAFTNLLSLETYKSGENEGEYKFLHNFEKLIPLWNQFEKISNIDEILKFQRL
jgi:hypothetical protein